MRIVISKDEKYPAYGARKATKADKPEFGNNVIEVSPEQWRFIRRAQRTEEKLDELMKTLLGGRVR